MKKATFSVLMPNYNHEKYISEALSAILRQSSQPDEIIVIDDASTDRSIDIIEQYSHKHPNFKVLRNKKNRGVAYNLNRLLESATSKYVCFPGSDDMVLPGFFEKTLALLEKHPYAGLSTAKTRLINEEGLDLGISPCSITTRESAYITSNDVLRKLENYDSWFMGTAAIYKRESLINIGGFRDELHSFCDGFAMMVIALNEGACFVPEALVSWRRMESGYSSVINQDYDKSLLMIQNALKLMRTTYRDIFSPSFIDYWERSRLCILHIRMLNPGDQEIEIEQESKRNSKLGTGKYLRIFKKIMFQFYFITMASYFVFRYRLSIIRLVRNKLRQLVGN